MTIPKWRAGEIRAVSEYNPAEELAAAAAAEAEAQQAEEKMEEGAEQAQETPAEGEAPAADAEAGIFSLISFKDSKQN